MPIGFFLVNSSNTCARLGKGHLFQTRGAASRCRGATAGVQYAKRVHIPSLDLRTWPMSINYLHGWHVASHQSHFAALALATECQADLVYPGTSVHDPNALRSSVGLTHQRPELQILNLQIIQRFFGARSRFFLSPASAIIAGLPIELTGAAP